VTDLTTVDFSRVSAALNLATQSAELEADRARAVTAVERSKGTARIIAVSALATAAVIVSIGASIWLARQRHVIEAKQTATAPVITPSVPHPQPPTVPGVPANKIKTDITQFNSISARDLTLANPYLGSLTAGHKYSSSNADRWNHAWCYADFRRDGITYHVELEVRDGTTAVPKLVPEGARRPVELSERDVQFLRARCPWKVQ
jgi:hypothetical protein